jgi:hypothetical protein
VAKAKHDTTRTIVLPVEGIAVIKPARTRHGPRKRGPIEYAQLAIQAMQGVDPSPRQNQHQLHRKVNAWLQKYPDWYAHFGAKKQVSRLTVRRALESIRSNDWLKDSEWRSRCMIQAGFVVDPE